MISTPWMNHKITFLNKENLRQMTTYVIILFIGNLGKRKAIRTVIKILFEKEWKRKDIEHERTLRNTFADGNSYMIAFPKTH